jgi:hypothetical protein
MSEGYLQGIEAADSMVRLIVDAVRDAGIAERTVIMVTADHGGLYSSHGDAAWEEITIPVIFSGAGVKKQYEIRQQVYVFDLAASMAFALGLEIPYEWTGRPVKAAFEGFEEPANQWDGISLLPPPAFPVEDRPHGRLTVDQPAEVNIRMPYGAEGVIRYTTDGSIPTRSSEIYTSPFKLNRSAVVKAKLFGEKAESPCVTACYRVADTQKGNGLKVKIYQQTAPMKEMPDFRTIRPAGEDVCYEFSLRQPEINTLRSLYGTNYALTFEGKIRIETDGMYMFHLHSSDGSKLYIDSDLVINKSGLGESMATGKIELKAGDYPVRLEYFKNGGGGEVTIWYESAGIPRQIVPADKLIK